MWNVRGFYKHHSVVLARASLALILTLAVSGCSEFAAEFNVKSKKASGGVTSECDRNARPFGGRSGGSNLICDEAQLILIDSKAEYAKANFALASDITITAASTKPLFYQVEYSGIFNGNGYTIKNFTYSKQTDQSSIGYAGFIGTLGTNGQIINVKFNGLNVGGSYYTGGVVGKNFGTIDGVSAFNSTVSGVGIVGGIAGTNNGGTIKNSFFSGNVVGQYYLGGIAAYNSTDNTGMIGGTIINSASQGNVVGNSTIGGITSQNSTGCTIDQSYSTSTVTLSMINSNGTGVQTAGGITAYNYGTISNVFFGGSVIGDGDAQLLSGIAAQSQAPSILTNSYSAASVIKGTLSMNMASPVSADDYNPAGVTTAYYYNVSGMTAQLNGWDTMLWTQTVPMDITARTLAEMKVQANFGFDFSKWRMGTGTYQFPVFQWMSASDPFNTAQGGAVPSIVNHSVLKMVDGGSASGYSFDNAAIGASSTNSITVTNTGTAAIRLGAVSLMAGKNFSNLGTGTCVANNLLSSGASCTIDLKFSPTNAAGMVFDGVKIAYTQGGQSYSASHLIEAVGTLDTSAYVYAQSWGMPADTFVGSTSTQFSVGVFVRSGGASVSFDSATVDDSHFAISSDSCTGNTYLNDYDLCQIDLTMTPDSVGYFFGAITLNYHTSDGKVSSEQIRFAGNGIPAPFAYGDGSVGNPFLLYSELDFNKAITYPTYNYKLMVDLDQHNMAMKGFPFYRGVFDGNGHTVSNMDDAFSANCMTGSVVKNLTIANANIVDNSFHAVRGLVCSRNYGLIQNVMVSGTITATDSEAVGGIVGENEKDGVIKDSIANVTITGNERAGGVAGAFGVSSAGGNYAQNTYSYGSVTGNLYTGGFAGAIANGSNAYDCGNFATVNGVNWTGGFTGLHYLVDLNRVFNVGNVTGTGDKTGGLVGINIGDATSTGYIIQSFNSGNVVGTSSVGGLIGENIDSTSGSVDSFTTGAVSGTAAVGGLVGKVVAGVFVRNLVVATSVTGGVPVSDVFGAGAPDSSVNNYYLNSTPYNDVYATKLLPAEVNAPGKLVGFDFVTPAWKTTSINGYAPTLSVVPAWTCSSSKFPDITCN